MHRIFCDTVMGNRMRPTTQLMPVVYTNVIYSIQLVYNILYELQPYTTALAHPNAWSISWYV